VNIFDSVISFFSGLGVRLFIPLAVTGLGVWLLRNLDKRWQSEAESNPALASVMPGNPGCWNFKHCSDEAKAKCRSYAHQEMPCWQCKRNRNGLLEEACLDCEMFKNAQLVVVQ